MAKSIFIGSMKSGTGKPELLQYFSSFGNVKKIKIILDWETGKSKNCAILWFKKQYSVDLVLAQEVHAILGWIIRVDRPDDSKRGTKILSSNKVMISQIPKHINNSDVLRTFLYFGEILNLKTEIKAQKSSTWSCSIEFVSQESANLAIGSRKLITVSGAQVKCHAFKCKELRKEETHHTRHNSYQDVDKHRVAEEMRAFQPQMERYPVECYYNEYLHQRHEDYLSSIENSEYFSYGIESNLIDENQENYTPQRSICSNFEHFESPIKSLKVNKRMWISEKRPLQIENYLMQLISKNFLHGISRKNRSGEYFSEYEMNRQLYLEDSNLRLNPNLQSLNIGGRK